MISNTPPAPLAAQDRHAQAPTLLWALRRALLGILILAVVVSLSAWLLYASLDQEAEAGADAGATGWPSNQIVDKRNY